MKSHRQTLVTEVPDGFAFLGNAIFAQTGLDYGSVTVALAEYPEEATLLDITCDALPETPEAVERLVKLSQLALHTLSRAPSGRASGRADR